MNKPHFGTRPPKNPNHHQIGKVPNYLQSLSLHLNWILFQLKSMRGNLGNPIRNLEDDIKSREFMGFDSAERATLRELYTDLYDLRNMCAELESRVAKFNKTKSQGFSKTLKDQPWSKS